jgi:hypothetical protein
MLHRLGIDHRPLTYRFIGRDHWTTDVNGEVVAAILRWYGKTDGVMM